ncbi:MAG: GNAT family N-acetyltransferase [Anaerolineales bacterium]
MAEIRIRQAVSSDILGLVGIDHAYSTDHVWQMATEENSTGLGVMFREVRLPRPMRVNYPRDPLRLTNDWTQSAAFLVAELEEARVGYLALFQGPAPTSGWVTDFAVEKSHRRKGIGARLLNAACSWCNEHGMTRLFLEMQSKNVPAIRLAKKMGFIFAGYSDRYYHDQDIALFFVHELI